MRWRTILVLAAAIGLTAAVRPPLDPAGLKVVGPAALARETFQGHASLRVEPTAQAGAPEDRLVVLPGGDFHDGVIDLWVAGAPGPGANPGARGFVGVMFRMADEGAGEVVYVRPTNGRAEDQERRNHAVQYVSPPDWPWERLRRETPSRYETYADMEPGRWIRLRVEVSGARARVFVNDAAQPTLLVNDLKRGADARGPVALWVGPGTIAHFRDVSIVMR